MLLSFAIKLGGLYIALSTFSAAQPNAVIVALAAFMMAGAEISEDTILNLVGRMFGRPASDEKKP